jgi:hypothetical protein
MATGTGVYMYTRVLGAALTPVLTYVHDSEPEHLHTTLLPH